MNILALDHIEDYQNSFHSLSPYVGKMRPGLARFLISEYATKDGAIYDPFAGSGTTLLEGWSLGYGVVGNDLNYYAYILSLGKLNPPKTLDDATKALLHYKQRAEKRARTKDLPATPEWVQAFYNIDTLKEIYSWVFYLKRNKEWFLLSCLLGILHHQRPGFLSYPASHGAPYLRDAKYPLELFPDMYQYRNVYEKLYYKVKRSYAHCPTLDYSLPRRIILGDATNVRMSNAHFPTIITSPPYMKSLTYARDNRMRLWFLGKPDWATLDKRISPEKNAFIGMMKKCFRKWASFQNQGDKCVVVIGDISIQYDGKPMSLSEVLIELSQRYYTCVEKYQDPIPQIRKVVKSGKNIKREIVILFERK